MHATDIAAYTTEDGEILCPDCADRRPHRYTVYTGVRTGTRTRGAIVDGSVDLGTHDSHAEAMEYAREVAGIALDDDGEIVDEDGVYTAWTVDEIDGEPAFCGYESDSIDRCADCGDTIDGCTLTRHGRQALAQRIADAIAGEYRGSIDRLQEDADAADMSVDLHRAAHLYAEIGGTYSRATLRAPDLLRAAAHCAEALTRYAHIAGYSMDVAPLADAAEAARELAQRIDDEDLTVDPEDAHWTLEDIGDDIDAALPAGLYYGAHPGDGSDIGIWPADLAD